MPIPENNVILAIKFIPKDFLKIHQRLKDHTSCCGPLAGIFHDILQQLKLVVQSLKGKKTKYFTYLRRHVNLSVIR